VGTQPFWHTVMSFVSLSEMDEPKPAAITGLF